MNGAADAHTLVREEERTSALKVERAGGVFLRGKGAAAKKGEGLYSPSMGQRGRLQKKPGFLTGSFQHSPVTRGKPRVLFACR